MVRILTCEIEKAMSPELATTLLHDLPEEIRRRAETYVNWQDAHLFVAAKLMLSRALEQCGVRNPLNTLTYSKFRRPQSPGFSGDFNISHAGQFAVCAVTDDRAVGIDVELVHPVNLEEFGQVFTDKEMEDIAGSENVNERFFKYWTMKEAVLKADGRGFHVSPCNITIDHRSNLAILDGRVWYLKPVEVRGNYICHMSTSSAVDDASITSEKYSLTELHTTVLMNK